ncbi:MAG: RsmD family RNA methyltransferase [Planctomycetaceae bacterium]|nr:RsmD family RNA methyltransferase [Planctomycetaceae bacterium]
MRIIAGSLRRRQLLTNPGNTTRPITDRAKTKLFDYVRVELPGAAVADVFAGTGTMGFESLSRGAKSVVFCEADHRAHALLVENASRLGASDSVLCWRVDVLRCSFRPKGDAAWTPFRVIFFDPPYAMIPSLKPGTPLYKSMERLARPDVSTDDALLVFRAPDTASFQLPPFWQTERELDVGSMRILLLRKAGAPGEE